VRPRSCPMIPWSLERLKESDCALRQDRHSFRAVPHALQQRPLLHHFNSALRGEDLAQEQDTIRKRGDRRQLPNQSQGGNAEGCGPHNPSNLVVRCRIKNMRKMCGGKWPRGGLKISSPLAVLLDLCAQGSRSRRPSTAPFPRCDFVGTMVMQVGETYWRHTLVLGM